jgi:hypothetical protein
MKKIITSYSKKTVLCFILPVLIFALSSECRALDGPYAKQGIYFGLTGNYNTVGNDFDGKTVEGSYDEVVAVPKIDNAYGFGVVLGSRKQNGAVELSYVRSQHDSTFSGYSLGDVTYNTINLDGKYYFLSNKPVQPFILFGICFPWLKVENSSVSTEDYETLESGDATFYGIGLNLGTGIAYYLNPRIAITGGITYRFNVYTGLSGEQTSGDLDESLFGGGANINFGITYTF